MRSRLFYRLANSSPLAQAAAIFCVLIVLVGLFEADNYLFGAKPKHVAKAVASPSPSPSPSPAPTEAPSPAPSTGVPIPVTSTVATAGDAFVAARSEPSTKGRLIENVDAHNLLGQSTVFLVVGQQPGWYQVLLQKIPNGTTAWVSASQVTISVVNDFILAHLSTYKLEHYNSGKLVGTYSMAIGASKTPTPTGMFYLWGLQTGVPPPYTPAIFALSALSETLTNWPYGGIVGIHGWSDSSVEGKAVSNGCLRLTETDAQRLVNANLPLGTPVQIVA
ncbi:MAG TPA: L,D-transpeptidase family protein [Actinomycetota bacterium]|nr:L,D-transpeptidase family protein [Actinomycetota bacterium]